MYLAGKTTEELYTTLVKLFGRSLGKPGKGKLSRMAVHKIQELLSLMQKNLECSICLELMQNPVITKCDHHFCRFCICEYLESKRHAPCPLCKQPVTKRSLTEKKEWGDIVNGIQNLISAFQQDSGTVFSPPHGPQSFFPCTPEPINSKPDSKVKGKRNVRNSKRLSNSQSKSTDKVTGFDDADMFAVPTPSTSGPSQVRKKPLPSSSKSSKTAEPEAVLHLQERDALLQYLDQGSCGSEEQHSNRGTSSCSDPAVENDASHSKPSPQLKRSSRQRNKSDTSNKEFQCFEENENDISVQDSQDSSRTVCEKNRRNVEKTDQAEKENPAEALSITTTKRGKGKQPKSGLAYSSQTSNDSIALFSQQGPQPEPVVTRTYSRRSRNRSLERKAEDWKTVLLKDRIHPENEHSRDEIDHEAETAGEIMCQDRLNQRKSLELNKVEEGKVGRLENIMPTLGDKNIEQNEIEVTLVDHDLPEGLGKDGDRILAGENLAEKGAVEVVPEPCEEFMLTPPVRKKPIFKRKSRSNTPYGADHIPAGREEENSPPASDPYLFVVGHTPVKKRGRPRSKDKKKAAYQLQSHSDEEAVVSEVPSEGSLFVEEYDHQSKNPVNGSSKSKLNMDGEKVVTEDLALCPSTSRVSTRSKQRSQRKHTNIKSPTVENDASKGKKSRRRGCGKADGPEDCQRREEQAQELASWIGQAEDHELLFCTQDVHTSMESMETESGENDEVDGVKPSMETIEREHAMDVENDREDYEPVDLEEEGIITLDAGEDSDDEICLVGPLPEKSKQANTVQQNIAFDVISEKTDLPCNGKTVASKPTDRNKAPAVSENYVGNKATSSPSAESNQQFHSTLLKPTMKPNSQGKHSAVVPSSDVPASSFESPAAHNIVLPSPMVGTTFPVPKTSGLQVLRQRKPTRRGLARQTKSDAAVSAAVETTATIHTDKDGASVSEGVDTFNIPDKPRIDTGFIEKFSGKKKNPNLSDDIIEVSSEIVSPSLDHSRRTTTLSASTSEVSNTAVQQKPAGLSRRSPRSLTPSQPSPLLPSKTTAAAREKGHTMKLDVEHLSEASGPSVGQRRSLRSKDSATDLHAITTVPSSMTEERGSESSVISPATKLQQATSDADCADSGARSEGLTCIPDTAELDSNSTDRKAERSSEERFVRHPADSDCVEMDVTAAPTDDEPSEGGEHCLNAAGKAGEEKEEGEYADMLEGEDEDPEADSNCSSATDDLGIVPTDLEFEEPDLTLQPEEIQQRFSEGPNTQDSHFKTPATQCKKQYSAASGQREIDQEHKNDRGILQIDSQTEEATVLSSAVTEIPESISMKDSTDSTKTPSSKEILSTQGVEAGYGESMELAHKASLSHPNLASPRNSRNGRSPRLRQKRGSAPQSPASDTATVQVCFPAVDSSVSSLSDTPSQSILRLHSAVAKPVTNSQTDKQTSFSQEDESNLSTTSAAQSRIAQNSKTALHEIRADEDGKTSVEERNKKSAESLTEAQVCFDEDHTLPDGQATKRNEVEEGKSKKKKEAELVKVTETEEIGGYASNEERDRISQPEKRAASKVLVQDTQMSRTSDEQSVSLFAEQVVLNSLPEEEVDFSPSSHRESQQLELTASGGFNNSREASEGLGKPAQNLKQDITSSFALKSPRQKLHSSPQDAGKERKSTLQEESGNKVLSENRSKFDASPIPMERKRKSQNRNIIFNAKMAKSPQGDSLTPDFELSGICDGKVISSAPPRTTSVASDSDDEDAVVIVRRTKRKCFSLDGSPLKPKSPISVKRRKGKGYTGRSLFTNFDDHTNECAGGNGSPGPVDMMTDGDTERPIDTDFHPPASPESSSLCPEAEIRVEEECNHKEPTQGLSEDLDSGKEVMNSSLEQTGERNQKRSPFTFKVSPGVHKKTVRGLARHKDVALVEDIPDGNTNRRSMPPSPQSPHKLAVSLVHPRESPSQVEDNENESIDITITAKLPHSRNIVHMHVEISEDEQECVEVGGKGELMDEQECVEVGGKGELMDEQECVEVGGKGELMDEQECVEVGGKGELMDAETAENAKSPLVLEDESAESDTCSDDNGDGNVHPNSFANRGQEATTVTERLDPIATQSSAKISSSLRSAADDLTIPPSDFDLKFDSDDEEEPQPAMEKSLNSFRRGGAHNQKEKGDLRKSSARDIRRKMQESESDSEVEIVSSKSSNDQKSQHSKRRMRQKSSPENQKKSETVSRLDEDSDEEEEVVLKRKRKNKRAAVIDSDSDSDHICNSGRESDSSLQLNFTSSSAMSSQSEIPTTQERSKMETELERLRREIAEVEARLQGRSSCPRSDSVGDSVGSHGGDTGVGEAGVHSLQAKSQTSGTRAKHLDSSDDAAEELSGQSDRMRNTSKSTSQRKSGSQAKKKRSRRQRISSDDDEDDGNSNEFRRPRQQLMDSYVCEIATDSISEKRQHSPLKALEQSSPFSTPVGKAKKAVIDDESDEDSSDLFLSPLSPSPPPPLKHSLARKESLTVTRSLFPQEAPSPSASRSLTKVRQSLDFQHQDLEQGEECGAGGDVAADLPQSANDSQDSNLDTTGSLKKIPESQFSVSSGSCAVQRSAATEVENLLLGQEDEVLSGDGRSVIKSGEMDDSDLNESPLPTPLIFKSGSLDAEEDKENVSWDLNAENVGEDEEKEEEMEDEDDLPRWKWRRMGFISSGLDQESSSQLRKLAEQNECKVYSKFNESVTHVIMNTEAGNRVCERTLKYFQGIAGQCWVLSYDWVKHSLQAGHRVPEKDYEIHGDPVKGENHGGPRSSRFTTSPLLEGFAFAPVGVSPDMSKKELSQLLRLCGGAVVEDPWALADVTATHRLILRCVDSDAQPPAPAEIELFNGQYKHFGLVTVAREWILDSICTFSLQPLQDYVFNTCKNLHLPF